jgi:hypothetical protein
VQVTCTRSILFRSEAAMVDPSQAQAAKPKETPYVKPAQSFTIPVSAAPIAIPAWVTELPEYQEAVKAGVIEEFHPAFHPAKAAAAPAEDEEEAAGGGKPAGKK